MLDMSQYNGPYMWAVWTNLATMLRGRQIIPLLALAVHVGSDSLSS